MGQRLYVSWVYGFISDDQCYTFFVHFSQRFGTHYVDFEDPERPRTPKQSALLLKQIFKDNGFPSAGNRTVVNSARFSIAMSLIVCAYVFIMN